MTCFLDYLHLHFLMIYDVSQFHFIPIQLHGQHSVPERHPPGVPTFVPARKGSGSLRSFATKTRPPTLVAPRSSAARRSAAAVWCCQCLGTVLQERILNISHVIYIYMYNALNIIYYIYILHWILCVYCNIHISMYIWRSVKMSSGLVGKSKFLACRFLFGL